MTAAAKVLGSFELLEAILLQADTYEICAATAVSTTWRAVVENSKALRSYLLNLPVRKAGRKYAKFNLPKRPINSSAKSVWHFGMKTANKGSLLVMRFPREDVEVFLFAPRLKDGHIKVLDDAYDIYAVATDFVANLEFRTKDGEKICRTKSKTAGVTGAYLSTFYAAEYGPGVLLE